jgi:putative ABC exporter
MRVLAFRERHSRGTAAFAIQHRYEHRELKATHRLFDVFRGPWTIVWKEWIAFARSPSMQRIFVFGLVMCAAVGALFGHIAAGSRDEIEETVGFASMAGNMILIFVAMGSAIGLSADISKPLWWMGRERLWVRLFAWTVGTSWRLAACLAVGIGAWAISLHASVVALAGIPIAVAIVLYLRAVGLALYSLFPSTIDQRGPLAMVRALLTYLLAAPPAIICALTGYEFYRAGMPLPHAVYAGIAAAILASLIETLALVAFAAARIAGQGVAFARAESM